MKKQSKYRERYNGRLATAKSIGAGAFYSSSTIDQGGNKHQKRTPLSQNCFKFV